jgi:magnesium transporter
MPTNKKSEHSLDEHISGFNLIFHKDTQVRSVIERIKNNPETWLNIRQVIVADKDHKYLGVVELKNLLASGRDITLENLVTENYPYVRHHYHQSHIAKIALSHGSENIPVLDDEDKFIGIVDATQILKILHEEHIDKLMHFSGILNSEDFTGTTKIPVGKALKNRLPWLIIGLVGGVLAANIIGFFQKTLASQLILAAFIPLIVYMADAIGTQTETIIVRDLTIESRFNIKKFFVKEMIISIYLSIICGALIGIYSFFRFTSPYLGVVLTISLISATIIATFVGTFIPWFIFKMKKDPALGTGPLTTVIQDVASVTIYFVIASKLL